VSLDGVMCRYLSRKGSGRMLITVVRSLVCMKPVQYRALTVLPPFAWVLTGGDRDPWSPDNNGLPAPGALSPIPRLGTRRTRA